MMREHVVAQVARQLRQELHDAHTGAQERSTERNTHTHTRPLFGNTDSLFLRFALGLMNEPEKEWV